MNYTSIISAVSALAIGNSLFFGSYLLSLRKKSPPNVYLALLLFALALRIGKSVLIIVFPDSPAIFPALGLIGMASIGPFLFLYVLSIFHKEWNNWNYCHFIPSLIIAASLPVVEEPTVYMFYRIIVAQILIYWAISAAYYRRESREANGSFKAGDWIMRLIIGVGIIWFAFFIQIVWDYRISYFVATTIAAFVLYGLSFWAMRKQRLFVRNGRKNGSVTTENSVALDIKRLFDEENIHRDFDITIQKVAKMLTIQPYLVSQAVNDQFHKSFPEMVNEYRVEDVKERLLDSSKDQHSIESIAYDSGFVTPSAFYATFKKLTGLLFLK